MSMDRFQSKIIFLQEGCLIINLAMQNFLEKIGTPGYINVLKERSHYGY